MKAEARDERDAPPEKEAAENESSAQQAAERAREMEESGEENVS